jgi:hypothetical protein
MRYPETLIVTKSSYLDAPWPCLDAAQMRRDASHVHGTQEPS